MGALAFTRNKNHRPFLWALVVFQCFHVCQIKADFNFEIGVRVHGHLSHYLFTASNTITILKKYRSNGIFPNGMAAPDRDRFLRIVEATLNTYRYDLLYVGLEDGTFVGTGANPRHSRYREPGESYEVSGELGDMEKHYKSCVDESGKETPCVLGPNELYVECVNGCSLTKCPDDISKADCSALDSLEKQQSCESNIKWCKSYEVKTTPEIGLGLGFPLFKPRRGYVPTSHFCIDESGVPTQTPGQVFSSNNVTTCYFEDKVTPVNRNLTGEYAYCNGGSCNSTFVGAYWSKQYDIRFRPWYQEARNAQRPFWHSPYEYSLGAIGITYSEPIYKIEEDEKQVFDGVLAVDISLANVSSFLFGAYSEKDTYVAVVESNEPSYVVAMSDGSMVTKFVRRDDESQLCLDNNFTIHLNGGECKMKRISVHELETPFGKVVSDTFKQQSEKKFPQSELLVVKSGDKMYASQSKPFVTPYKGLDWVILVMEPTEPHPGDTAEPGDAVFPIIIAAAITGTIVCSSFFAEYMRHRHRREIAYGDWRFTGAFIFNCILFNMSSFSMIGANTDSLCMLRYWLLNFFFVSSLAPLIAKTLRMYILLGDGSVIPRQRTMSHKTTALLVSLFVVVEILILVVFSFVDPYQQVETTEQTETGVEVRRFCAHETVAFRIVQMIYQGCILIIGCYLSYKTRHHDEKFGESKQLMFAMYNIAFTASIVLIVAYVVDAYQSLLRGLVGVGIFWTTSFSSGVFVLPRLLKVQRREKRRNSSQTNGTPPSNNISVSRENACAKNPPPQTPKI